jgi:hypothetical protein
MPARPALIQRRYPANHYTESANTTGVLSEIYRVRVPRGVVWKIDPSRPFLLYLTYCEDVTPGGTGSQALPVTYSPARVLNPAGGYTDGQYQGVYLKSDGTPRTITAVADNIDDPTAKTITISDATAEAHRVCYVPWASGRVAIKIEAPRGLGGLSYPIFEMDTQQLHTMNQWRFNRLDCPFPLPPDFAIVVYLDADWVNAFTSGATAGSISLPFNKFQLPILQAPEAEFYEVGEPSPGAALRARVEDLMKELAR